MRPDCWGTDTCRKKGCGQEYCSCRSCYHDCDGCFEGASPSECNQPGANLHRGEVIGMTSERKLADLLDRYTRYYKEAMDNPQVRWNDGAFRELCRDLCGELGDWIIRTKAESKPRIDLTKRPVVRVEMTGWGG